MKKTVKQAWDRYEESLNYLQETKDKFPSIYKHIKAAYYAGALGAVEVLTQPHISEHDFQNTLITLTDQIAELATEIIANKSTIH